MTKFNLNATVDSSKSKTDKNNKSSSLISKKSTLELTKKPSTSKDQTLEKKIEPKKEEVKIEVKKTPVQPVKGNLMHTMIANNMAAFNV